MKYTAIVMAPHTIEFESEGDHKNVGNQAWGLCNNFSVVNTEEDTFVPRLLLVIPESKSAPEMPMVFDPPPMAA